MNDEIKEILDYIDDRIIPNEKFDKIRNYITNLQQENERLKKQLNCKEVYSKFMPENIEFIIMSKADYERQELDNKSRKDKAKEYLKNCDGCLTCKYFLGEDEYGYGHCELQNILNGGDE